MFYKFPALLVEPRRESPGHSRLQVRSCGSSTNTMLMWRNWYTRSVEVAVGRKARASSTLVINTQNLVVGHCARRNTGREQRVTHISGHGVWG